MSFKKGTTPCSYGHSIFMVRLSFLPKALTLVKIVKIKNVVYFTMFSLL